MIQTRKKAYRGDMTIAEWLKANEQGDLFSAPVENFDKMIKFAADLLLRETDELELREQLKTVCAWNGVLYDGHSIGEALRRARGRVQV